MKKKSVSLASASEEELMDELRRRYGNVVILTSPKNRHRRMYFFGDAVVCAFLCAHAQYDLHRLMMETQR